MDNTERYDRWLADFRCRACGGRAAVEGNDERVRVLHRADCTIAARRS